MIVMYLVCLGLIILVAIWLQWRFKNSRLLELSKQFPGPTPLPVLGNALHFMVKPEEMPIIFQKLLHDYGSWFRFWLGPELNIIVNDPDDIRIMLTSSKVSVKGPGYKYMADLLGEGILSGSGPVWKRHRKIVMPNYGKRAIEGYEDVVNIEINNLVKHCRQFPPGSKCDIYQNVVKFTSYTVCQTLMGLSKGETLNLPHFQEVVDNSPRIYDIVFDRMTKWWLKIDPIFWCTESYKYQTKFIKIMHAFSQAIIDLRMKKMNSLDEESKVKLINNEEDSQNNTELGIIDRLILSKELTNLELLQETFTIFTASQEASAKISSAFILMMAHHPECQDKLYEEIKTVLGENDRDVTEQDFKEMIYLEMACKETLRMFPIGAMLQRTVTEDIKISKGILPAGCALTIPLYHLQRDPRYWDKPNSFNPERFTPENINKRPTHCYIPFSLGPMDCLGRYFGIKLIKTFCVKFLREFRVSPINKNIGYEDMKMNIAISASPLEGYWVTVAPRH